ncbi:MAG: 6,7-dimethyl-8-ribityllumazine synthase, partial [Patescibacteria group bacterium]
MTPRISIIAAQFNPEIVEPMVSAAKETLEKSGATVGDIVRVPGSYEIPLAADMLLKQRNADALIVLGYIEKGETLHGEVMGHVVHRSIVELQLQYSIPIAIGIIGPGATIEQAHPRNSSSASGAAKCALQMGEVV